MTEPVAPAQVGMTSYVTPAQAGAQDRAVLYSGLRRNDEEARLSPGRRLRVDFHQHDELKYTYISMKLPRGIRMMIAVGSLAWAASAGQARAQQFNSGQFNSMNSGGGGEMTAVSGQNSLYSVANRFNGNSQIETLKLAPNGSGIIWRAIYNQGFNAFATATAGDRDGGLFVVGTAQQQGSYRQVLVLKYGANSSGGLSWDYIYSTQNNAVPTFAATDGSGNLSVAANVSDGQGGTQVQVFRVGANKDFMVSSQPFNQGRANYAQSLSVDAAGNAEVIIQSLSGGVTSGSYQTYRVLFSGNGGGYRILEQL